MTITTKKLEKPRTFTWLFCNPYNLIFFKGYN